MSNNNFHKKSYKKSYKKPYKKNHYKKYNKRNWNNNSTTVKIDNLPLDMTKDELTKLVNEWGRISRVNLNFYQCCVAYIDFNSRDDAEYFAKALDRTGFDNVIINVTVLESRS